jgi:hypothetical protein
MLRSRRWTRFWLVVVGVGALAGCGTSSPSKRSTATATDAPANPAAGHADPRRQSKPSRIQCRHALTAKGSNPNVLPGPVLIADKANSRLLEIDQCGHVLWQFPRPGDLAPGQTFNVPDDAFFTPDGKQVIATQEDDYAITLVDIARHLIAFRYGTPGVPASTANHLYNPDDAIALPGGRIVAADIKNCRLIVLKPPAHDLVRQLGTTSSCVHAPPTSFGSPNGAFPMQGGGTVVTEINGDWIDFLSPAGKLRGATHAPGFSYPSDTNQIGPNRFLSVDYTTPGAIEVFNGTGHLIWRFAPNGSDALDHPSLALPLPNGDVIANDDYNDRVIVVDPKRQKIVWQYGHTNSPGTAPGQLNIPDGVDLAPPHSLIDNFPNAQAPGG